MVRWRALVDQDGTLLTLRVLAAAEERDGTAAVRIRTGERELEAKTASWRRALRGWALRGLHGAKLVRYLHSDAEETESMR
jgi:hypothetical protein